MANFLSLVSQRSKVRKSKVSPTDYLLFLPTSRCLLASDFCLLVTIFPLAFHLTNSYLTLMDFLPDIVINKLYNELPLLGMYIQSHYRFKIPFSRYFQREPELIFDIPWRLEPGQVPIIFLLIKDAHDYPCHLNSVEIEVKQNDHVICNQTWKLNKTINDRQTHIEFVLTECELLTGEVEIFPTLNYTINGKSRKMLVENYRQLTKRPLRVTLANEPLPKLEGWLSGDTHLHTSLTDDQVEFGASLEQTRKAAELFGLDFITATDHSYDLDDLPDNYLKNDPDLVKWKTSRAAIKEMNKQSAFTVIPAEEISVANAAGANIHLLHYNDDQYFPGSGDGAEDWLNLKPELHIRDVLAKRSSNTASVAAHSAYKVPTLQGLLLKRGFWKAVDHEHHDLDGVQILSGTPASEGFQESRQVWINTLLKGYHLSAFGGSDAHGNFNRNWHIKLPMWSLGTVDDQILGQARTLLRSKSNDAHAIIQAMQAGRVALSTGPVGDLTLEYGNEQIGIGDTLNIATKQELTVNMHGFSTAEFGKEMDVTLYWGDLVQGEESILHHEVDLEKQFNLQIPFTPETNGYLRMEISSEGSYWPGVYVSSPIWIEIS